MGEEQEPQFTDDLFRVRKKSGAYEVVDAPHFDTVLADAHTHVQYLADPVMAIARAGMREVSFMNTVVDVHEDDPAVFDDLKKWSHKAAVSMQLMLGRC